MTEWDAWRGGIAALLVLAGVLAVCRWRVAAAVAAVAAAAAGLAFDAARTGNLDQRTVLLEEMRRRPADAWPRGTGHALLAGFDAPLETRAWVEAGGSLSPGLRSFGVSVWVVDEASGKRIHTSDDIDIRQVRHRYARDARDLPTLTVTTPFYEAMWSVEGGNAYALTLRDLTDDASALEVVVRSVGPAGGPLGRIEATDDGLRLDGRWEVHAPGTRAVALGEESSAGGWAYARLRVRGAVTRIALVPRSGVTPAAPLPRAQGCSLHGFPQQFTDMLEANATHLLLGIVDGQTRPGDPVNYPLAWQRDGAYVVVALARCGFAPLARRLAAMLAREDFFGGFGAEADAPGLALWALAEVARAAGDPALDAELWPHVARKAALIQELVSATRPVRRAFSGPMVPKWRSHPESDLVAEPARGGLIQGRMDWERPVFFINAAAQLGLAEAAAFARRAGRAAEAAAWDAAAGAILAAYRQRMAELSDDAPELRNERTTINALYPSEAAERGRVAKLLRSRPREQSPLWTYFTFAQAHQWLRLGEPQRARDTVDWFAAHDRLPGLWVLWEGKREENRFGGWDDVRGNVAPRGITPHYWASAELQLLALEMLAYAERAPRRVVVGAGVPSAWTRGPLAVEDVGTALGAVSWSWDGAGTVSVKAPDAAEVVLGPGFPPGSVIERGSAARHD